MRYVFFLLFLLIPTTTLARFSDVFPSHPYYTAIEYVQQEEIVNGYADGRYKPDSAINRAEFTKILVSAHYDRSTIDGCLQNIVSLFTDTPLDAWFTPYICTAFRESIVSGYPDVSYKPGNFINMAEAAKIITNTFSIPRVSGDDPVIAEYNNYFATSGRLDEESNPYWWQVPIATLEQANILPSSYIGPDQFITRGEMAEMIYRVHKG